MRITATTAVRGRAAEAVHKKINLLRLAQSAIVAAVKVKELSSDTKKYEQPSNSFSKADYIVNAA